MYVCTTLLSINRLNTTTAYDGVYIYKFMYTHAYAAVKIVCITCQVRMKRSSKRLTRVCSKACASKISFQCIPSFRLFYYIVDRCSCGMGDEKQEKEKNQPAASIGDT